MIPELGHFALTLALLVAMVQGAVPLIGAARGDGRWMAVARPAAKLMTNSPSYYGMLVAHLGVAIFIIGVALVNLLAHRFASRW
jgi:cytochrome c biogenesis factor